MARRQLIARSVGRPIDVTGESALLTTAEIAVAFAGFASVVAVFRRREDSWAPQDVLRFQLMITASLAVVFFALFPIAIHFFGASASSVWSFSSGVLCLFISLTLGLVARRAVSLTVEANLNPYISWSFIAAGLATVALQALNAAGVIFEQELGPYFVGLLYLLFLAAVSFARMLPVGAHSDGE
jgi:hypothetical protein